MIHIIIPAYNRVTFTVNCLESIKRQVNYKDLNIVLIDDGSTDNTFNIIKKISKGKNFKRYRFFILDWRN